MKAKVKNYNLCDCPDEEIYSYESDGYYNLYIKNPYYEQNEFVGAEQVIEKADYQGVKDRLPKPFWEGHQNNVDAYNFGFQKAFENVKHPTTKNKLIRSYADTAFNDNTFMSDSSSMMWYCKYANHVFDFRGTLDNFYSRQHLDGFICREIRGDNGEDRFHRFDPISTGPLWLCFSEWNLYCHNGDRERLKKIFAPLMAFHGWFQKYRTNPDGSYWYSGLASTMDNQPRAEKGYSRRLDNGKMAWADATLCALIDCDCLIKIAKEIGRENEIDKIRQEKAYLLNYVTKKLWNKKKKFFFDRNGDGTFSDCKSIGAFWALHVDDMPKKYVKALVSHLMNKNEFNRFNPVPAISADSPMYDKNGCYWRGGVWSCTNYMVFSGLVKQGYTKEAFELAKRHNTRVCDIYKTTQALWEVYAPDSLDRSVPSVKNYIGWAALSTISILLEFVFGIIPKPMEDVIEWNVNLTEEFSVENYPFNGKTVNLYCAKRANKEEEPVVKVTGDKVMVKVRWGNNEKIIGKGQISNVK